MFTRYFMSKHLPPMVKYTISALLLVCLVVVQGVAEDLVKDTTIPNLNGSENINIKTFTLTLNNTDDSVYSGILSSSLIGAGQVIKTGSGQLTLSPESGYTDLVGPVTVQEGTLDLAAENIFTGLLNHLYTQPSPSITNNGTIIVNASQFIPNLSGSGNIQINGNNTLTLANSVSSEFSGDISGTGQIVITKPKWDSTAQLKLSKEGGYSNFMGSVTIQASESTENASHAEGVLLTAANIFYNASSITNDGTLIVSASQVLPNLRGSGKIQINSDVQTLTFNNTSDTDYAGSIEGATNLIKTGAGELTLSHDNGFPSFTGSITVDEGSLILEKWNMFRISPPTVTNNAKIMVGGGVQVFKNLSGSGDIEIEANTDLISIYENDCIISGKIIGGADHTEFEKKGPGTLTLTGANEFSGYIKIDEGKIIFKGDAIDCNEEIEGNVVPGTNRVVGDVEFYTEGTKFICIPDDSKHILVKNIEKTGDSDSILRIYEGATGCVRAESFVISSGRLDYGGYFQSIPPEGQELGIFDVKGETTFSPGITIDEHSEVVDTIGRITISNEAILTIEQNALILFEFDAYNEGLKFDNIVFEHENSTFVAADSTIDIAFLSDDAWKWAQEGSEYWIVNDHGYKDKEGNPIPEGVSIDFNNLLRDTYKDYFSLVGRYDGLYLVGKGAPEPPVPPSLAVPEPSSWALMIGALTFLLFLKKKRGC